ncbi:bis(5'-nucleosyl)-tetraphosphatase (symmetrical) YqeK [Streptococcus thoraltensis]|uniref:bis(5'-nucleosyl)-tetraphosphatase (symmetrical) YqeK n=1 Tax=Streptococcus thoraltensis TaxID=55085 RepID=UPI002A7EE11B|nr:bis(5'-nucleosyl)-tetraphosphatase (symmetrical) YqeK [Streptococcus thoraltensis]MDY4762090.1 bis(5'-nucleosyl)-tetraphosphatase (symmetrical) YqeK [Streptococcus thoraltensis]
MSYQSYTAYSRDQLLEKLQSVMSAKRFTHVLGVERAAIELARLNGYDEVKAGLAGLLHDYAKESSDQEFLNLIDKYHLDPDLKHWNNNVWHGVVGIYKIQEELGLKNPEILRAIEIHTIGAEEMTTLDKIVYVADYIEHNRDFPLVAKAREIAQQDLNQAVAYETVNTVAFLAQKAQPIYPKTIETYNSFLKYMKEV